MAVKVSNKHKRTSFEDTQESTPSKKKRLEFCVSSFQKRLKKQEECYEALEEFAKLCHVSKGKDDPAVQFLREGGQLADIFNILNRSRNRVPSQVSVVFSALHVLLLRIQTKVPERCKSAEEMCHHLLSSHLSDIHSLLSAKSSAQLKKVVLQLLTAVVTLNATLAKDVLSYVSLTIDVVDNIVSLARPNDPKSVRICFIHFLMAFLVEGNPSVIRLLLDKRLILTSIIRGLKYDPSSLVIFVLTTIRTKLVEVNKVIKTQKIHTFNTRVMCDLLSLYKWKGPAGFAQKGKKNTNKVSCEVDLEQQEAVAEAVHALLLALCTSYRHGIVFHDPALGTKSKMNALVATVLKELGQPWENKLLTDLVVQIACVCPELSPISFSRVAPVLEPRASCAWIKAVKFVTQLITSMKLNGLTSLEPNAALTCVKRLAASRLVVIPVASPGLLHEHPAVRHKTGELLVAVLNAVDASLAALTGQQVVEFQSHVTKMLPSAAVLEKAWSKALKNSIPKESPPVTEVPIPNPTQQMLVLVDLIFLYQKHFPLLLDTGDDYGALATTLAKVINLDDSSEENIVSLKLKILQLLTQLDTSVLEPGKAGFIAAIATLLRASCKSDALSVEAHCTLGALLLKCRLLEQEAADVTGELGIWLQSCQAVKPSQRSKIVAFLQNILINVATNPVPYLEQTSKAQEVIFSSTYTEMMKQTAQNNLTDQLFQELLVVDGEKLHTPGLKKHENQTNEKHCFSDFSSTVELSPMLMYVNSIESEETLDASVVEYLSYVLVHLLHMQADPKPFLSIVGHWTALPSAVLGYINSWSTEQPIVLAKPFGSCTPETSLSRVLLEQGKAIPELEDCSSPISVLLLVRLVVFHVVQLAERQQLTDTVISVSLDVFLALLSALQETVSHDKSSLTEKYYIKFFSLILKHPVLLCYFSPLHKQKHITEKLVTNLLLNFLERTADLKLPVILKDTRVLLKEKLVRNILHYYKRSKHTSVNPEILLAATKTSALTGPEMSSLISKLIKKMTVQPWTELMSYLLCNVECLSPKQVSVLGNSLVEHLQEVEEMSSAAWTVADSFQHYLQRFPHCVNHVPCSLFEVLVCKRGVNLASVILYHQEASVSKLRDLVEQNSSILAAPDVIFPLLSNASHHGPLPSSVLKAAYKQYQEDIIEAMQPPLAAATCFTNYPDIIKQLIVECMDSEECRSLCLSVTQNWKSFKLCTPFHLSVIHGLQVLGGWKKLATVLVQMLLHQLKQMLKMKVQSTLIKQLCSLLGEHLADNRVNWQKQELQSDENWNTLPVLVLQTGLSGSDHHLSQCLFSAFARLLWRAKEVHIAARVFEMTISHSRFLDIVLIQERAGLKLAVLQLLLTCYEVAPRVMQAAQVPIWLGAYSGTLSHSDQVILKILHCLNSCRNVNLGAYKPFLWGDAAINHYSVHSRTGMMLWRVPQAIVALELLQRKMVEKTIAKFPIHRKLFLRDQENILETDTFFSSCMVQLEPCQPDVYDPAFMIPLLSHIMAPESVVQEYKFSRLGGLAITLSALGSKCGYMRTAALSVLSRYQGRLNPNNSNANLAEQFVECIRAGIGNLKSCQKSVTSKSAPKKKCKSETEPINTDNENSSEMTSTEQGNQAPKVPNLSAAFVARASLILTHPAHTLYQPLNRFILAKPALDLSTVPDLLELLRPGSVDFRAYQLWLLETLQCGMRTDEDVGKARGHHVFKMLFALFSSSLSDAQTKTLILRLLETTLRVRTGSNILMKSGMLPWLYGIFNSLQKEDDKGLIMAFIRVIVTLKEGAPSLVRMVVPFLFKLPPVMESPDISFVLQVALDSTQWISHNHLVVLLRLCQGVLDHKIIEECCAQLGLSEEVVRKSITPIEIGETSTRDKENIDVNKTELCDMLRNVVHRWLTHKDLSNETLI